jgi:hypothetical protein
VDTPSLVAELAQVLKVLRRVDAASAGRVRGFVSIARGFSTVLRWYIDSLPIWWVPRKDIVRSYAPIACCMYAKMATRKVQFPQATQLLECFGYKSDPNRQKRTKDRHKP